jgi:hypothetical protein
MYSTENYIWGWIAYSVGVLCLLSLLWMLIRKISLRWLKHILLLCLLVIFFTPVTAYPDNPYWAPAFFVSLYEGIILSGQGMGFQRGLAPIITFGFIAIIFYLLLYPIIGRRTKK